MLQTEVYEEITDGRCPVANNLHAVQAFLDYLVMKQVLNSTLTTCPGHICSIYNDYSRWKRYVCFHRNLM